MQNKKYAKKSSGAQSIKKKRALFLTLCITIIVAMVTLAFALTQEKISFFSKKSGAAENEKTTLENATKENALVEDGENNSENHTGDEGETETIIPEDSVSEFRMSMGGDYIIYSSIYNGASRYAGGNGYDFSPMIENLRTFTSQCDVNYYNQETILGGSEMGLSDYPMFVSPQEAGDAMVDLGYNLVSTATNHSMDGWEEGIQNSCDYWEKQDGVFMTGTFRNQEERDAVHILECNDITYTMLSYTYSTNGIPVEEEKQYLVNVWPTDLYINDPAKDKEYQNYKKQVKKDIEAVRDQVDVVIVALHAGIEYMDSESAYQQDMAEFLAENGVNLVIGTHPHVIEPAKYIGDTLVFYSLGNLLCSQYQDDDYNKVVSMMPILTVRKTVKNGETKITFEDMECQLMYCYYNQATWSGHNIVPFSSPEIANYLSDYKRIYEKYVGIFQRYDTSLTVAPCA